MHLEMILIAKIIRDLYTNIQLYVLSKRLENIIRYDTVGHLSLLFMKYLSTNYEYKQTASLPHQTLVQGVREGPINRNKGGN